MLPKGLEKPYTEFYQAVFADGVVDGKNKVLVAMAVAMARDLKDAVKIGCS